MVGKGNFGLRSDKQRALKESVAKMHKLSSSVHPRCSLRLCGARFLLANSPQRQTVGFPETVLQEKTEGMGDGKPDGF